MTFPGGTHACSQTRIQGVAWGRVKYKGGTVVRMYPAAIRDVVFE